MNLKYSNVSATLCDTCYGTEHAVQVPPKNHLWPVDGLWARTVKLYSAVAKGEEYVRFMRDRQRNCCSWQDNILPNHK